MAEQYQVVSQSEGKLEIQSLQYIFDNCGNIVEAAVVGDDYYDPNTGQVTQLTGQMRYENISVSGVLSPPQFKKLDSLFKSGKAKDGSLTATHQLGGVTTILTGVKLRRRQWGQFDKLSNSPAKIELEISFSGARIV